MRLKYQIFLTLLIASLLLIVTMFAISNWSFSRGFLDYVNQTEISRLTPLTDRLVFRYEKQGNWDWLDDSVLDERAPASVDRSGKPAPRNERRGPPRFFITDVDKNVLAGRFRPHETIEWVDLISEGKLIGYLGFAKQKRVDRYFDQVFADKQKKSFAWTALAMILFSAIMSIPLASRLVRPILNLNQAVDEISGGNYTHRLTGSRNDELGDLADNVNRLGETLEHNRSARQRWIAEISHELRTPLAVLRGEIEAVQDGVRELDDTAIDSLHNEAMQLGRLVDDLHTLSMSDIGALSYQMESLDLAELLNDFIANNQAVLTQQNISCNIGSSVKNALISGDAQRLDQMFSNLLQNTCRYTNDGGRLDIQLSLFNGNASTQIVIDWFDSSPGVEPAALAKLFEPLYRAENSRNREAGGSGLGLSIVKRIVEAHQGSIVAAASSLGGLHIKINIPAG